MPLDLRPNDTTYVNIQFQFSKPTEDTTLQTLRRNFVVSYLDSGLFQLSVEIR